MEIKIEASPELLQELHEMLYAHDKEIEIDEQYGPSEGYQKESMVTALIMSASSPVIYKLISGAIKIWQARIKAEVQKEKNKNKAETDLIKFFVKEQSKWEQKKLSQLIKAEKEKTNSLALLNKHQAKPYDEPHHKLMEMAYTPYVNMRNTRVGRKTVAYFELLVQIKGNPNDVNDQHELKQFATDNNLNFSMEDRMVFGIDQTVVVLSQKH